MSQPKKKTSPRRRDQRRGAFQHQLRTVTWINGATEPTRPHRVTLESIDAYVAARTAKKKTGKSATR
ncbi:MAG: 50S ribosomal protein L32 [Bdellovibrionales bacterium]|nr:50S ribosomal protein L32 [Bdellovibrionales bacterium]